jgi:HAD superfamily hydrolase (TIGR01509 family)
VSSSSFDLVILDCDGVLVDSETISRRVLTGQLAELGVDVDPDYFQKHFLGRSFPRVAETIRAAFKLNLGTEFEEEYRRRLLASFENELKAVEGVEDMLDSLAVRTCVATSSSPARVRRTLEVTKLDHRFGNDVFTASEVRNGKPAPDLFLHVAQRMDVEPQRCLVVEDSIPGIEAGIAASMAVWRFVGASHLRDIWRESHAQFSDVPAFDNWKDFLEMAPGLKREREKTG